MTTRIVDDERTFGLEFSCRDGVAMIRAAGRLVEGAGADPAAWSLPRSVAGVRRVVLDLQGVTAIDAVGIGRLVSLRQCFVARGAAVVIGAAAPRVLRVLHLTRLDLIFESTRPLDRCA